MAEPIVNWFGGQTSVDTIAITITGFRSPCGNWARGTFEGDMHNCLVQSSSLQNATRESRSSDAVYCHNYCGHLFSTGTVNSNR